MFTALTISGTAAHLQHFRPDRHFMLLREKNRSVAKNFLPSRQEIR